MAGGAKPRLTSGGEAVSEARSTREERRASKPQHGQRIAETSEPQHGGRIAGAREPQKGGRVEKRASRRTAGESKSELAAEWREDRSSERTAERGRIAAAREAQHGGRSIDRRDEHRIVFQCVAVISGVEPLWKIAEII